MIFLHDTRDKIGKHKEVERYLLDNGHKIVRSKMYVGDITLLENQSVCIDLKQNLGEVYSNVIQGNVRFKNECVRAAEAGIRLVVLIADANIRDIREVHTWDNPRLRKWEAIRAAQKKGKLLHVKLSPKPTVSSEQLQRAMETMAERYGVVWQFCRKEEAGKRILEILGVEEVKAWQIEAHL